MLKTSEWLPLFLLERTYKMDSEDSCLLDIRAVYGFFAFVQDLLFVKFSADKHHTHTSLYCWLYEDFVLTSIYFNPIPLHS